jgi:hypothetical protein
MVGQLVKVGVRVGDSVEVGVTLLAEASVALAVGEAVGVRVAVTVSDAGEDEVDVDEGV